MITDAKPDIMINLPYSVPQTVAAQNPSGRCRELRLTLHKPGSTLQPARQGSSPTNEEWRVVAYAEWIPHAETSAFAFSKLS
jgi:hypothetical protein